MIVAGRSDQEIFAIATIDNFIEGSTAIDHATHTRDFTERLKGIITNEHLEQIYRHYQAEWGFFSSQEWIAVVRGPSSVAIL